MIVLSEQDIIPSPSDLSSGGPGRPTLWIGEFNQETASDFFQTFNEYLSDQDVKSILIYIDSFGGEVDALASMFEIVDSSPKPVYTCAIGKAFSAGGMFAALGTPGNRYIAPNSRLMFHRISLMELEITGERAMSLAKELLRMNDHWLKKVIAKSNLDWKEFNDILNSKGGEWYLNAKEAVKYGFVDHIGVPRLREIRQWVMEIGKGK